MEYVNHEGVPELGEASVADELRENRFEAVTLFRRNPHCFIDGDLGLADLLPMVGTFENFDSNSWQRQLDDFLAASSARCCLDSSSAHAGVDSSLGCSRSVAAQRSFRFWLQRTQNVFGRAQYFLAYVNGKGAARVDSGALPDGVHRFGVHRFGSCRDFRSYWDPSEATVLHYAHGCLESVAAKLQRLRDSTGKWWKQFPLYVQGRELDPSTLTEIYERAVALTPGRGEDGEATRQVDSGVCFRYDAKLRQRCRVAQSPLSELD